MDTTKTEREEVRKEVAELERKLYGESFSVDFDKVRQTNKASTEETLKKLDKKINERREKLIRDSVV